MKSMGNWAEWLFSTYYDDVKNMCIRFLHYSQRYMPYVDDCVQEVFLAALKKQDKLEKYENIRLWLVNASKKQCDFIMRREASRQRKVGVSVSFDEQEDVFFIEDDITRWLIRHDISQSLAELVSQLSPQEAVIYNDYFLERKTVPQIKKKHDMSEVSIRGTIQRIRKKAMRINFFCLFLFWIV